MIKNFITGLKIGLLCGLSGIIVISVMSNSCRNRELHDSPARTGEWGPWDFLA